MVGIVGIAIGITIGGNEKLSKGKLVSICGTVSENVGSAGNDGIAIAIGGTTKDGKLQADN